MKKLILTLVIFSAPVMAQDRVVQYDYNKDGKVSFEDINRFCAVSKNLFEKADKNGDGFLSNTEMSSARRYIFARCMDTQKNA